MDGPEQERSCQTVPLDEEEWPESDASDDEEMDISDDDYDIEEELESEEEVSGFAEWLAIFLK